MPFQVSGSPPAATPAKSCPLDKNTDYRIHKEQHAAWLLGMDGTAAACTAQPQQPDQRVLKSYSNFRPVKTNSTYNFDSSSLFCSSHAADETWKPIADVVETSNNSGEQQQVSHPDGREYSLFGSHQFGSSFLKTPII